MPRQHEINTPGPMKNEAPDKVLNAIVLLINTIGQKTQPHVYSAYNYQHMAGVGCSEAKTHAFIGYCQAHHTWQAFVSARHSGDETMAQEMS